MRRSLLLPLFAAAALASGFSGTVTRVVDGDTLAVASGDYTIRVRLHGVDAPEKAQAGGPESLAFVESLVLNQDVTLVERDIDRYGRVVCDVRLADGRLLNREIIKAGHAWWYARYSPLSLDLRLLEAGARENRRGLWADDQPQPPWEWRKEEHAPMTRTAHSRRSERRSQPRSARR